MVLVTNPIEEPGADNLVLPFRTETSGISGRLVRLGSVVDEILQRHNYPDPVSEVLGEALALTGMLGSQLKFDGKLIVVGMAATPVLSDRPAPHEQIEPLRAKQG